MATKKQAPTFDDHPALALWRSDRAEALAADDHALAAYLDDMIAQHKAILAQHAAAVAELAEARAEHDRAYADDQRATAMHKAGAPTDEIADQLELQLARARARVRYWAPRYQAAVQRELALQRGPKGDSGRGDAERSTDKIVAAFKYGGTHVVSVAESAADAKPCEIRWYAFFERRALANLPADRPYFMAGGRAYERADLEHAFARRRGAVAGRRGELEAAAKRAAREAADFAA